MNNLKNKTMKEIVTAFAIGFGICFLIFLPRILSNTETHIPKKSGFILNQKDVAIIYSRAYHQGMYAALKCSLSTVDDWNLCIDETFKADSINNSNAFNQSKYE